MLASVLFLLAVRKQTALPCQGDPIVETTYGPVRGSTLLSRGNREFFGFKGIPYAAPPVGELRFKGPVPPVPWVEVRDARKHGPVCVQKDYLYDPKPTVIGSEDCLYVNVYTPQVNLM